MQVTDSDYRNRILGLDILRACAIVIVIYNHTFFMTASQGISALYKISAFLGIELFFVLSGFLVGYSLLSSVNDGDFNVRKVVRFLKRRWFRTLPGYYLFLLINIVLMVCKWRRDWEFRVPAYSFFMYMGDSTKSYWIFLQNMFEPIQQFFIESWSLPVEEWFYLSFPVSLLILSTLVKTQKKYTSLILILVFIALSTGYRLSLSLRGTIGISIETVAGRMDSIMYGVLAAYVKLYFSGYWGTYRKHAGTAGFIGLLCCLYTVMGVEVGILKATFFIPAVDICLCLLLPLASGYQKGHIFFARPITHVSLISYSLFLLHRPFLYALGELFTVFKIPQERLQGYPQYFLYLTAIIILSSVQYRYLEKPLTQLRERYS